MTEIHSTMTKLQSSMTKLHSLTMTKLQSKVEIFRNVNKFIFICFYFGYLGLSHFFRL